MSTIYDIVSINDKINNGVNIKNAIIIVSSDIIELLALSSGRNQLKVIKHSVKKIRYR